jgi:hypothetical protein
MILTNFWTAKLQTKGTDSMTTIKVKKGDVVGIALQYSDLPMLQFMLNGELLLEHVNRFRGTVYPSVFLPDTAGLSIQLVFNENEFEQMAPHARYGPVIVARGII